MPDNPNEPNFNQAQTPTDNINRRSLSYRAGRFVGSLINSPDVTGPFPEVHPTNTTEERVYPELSLPERYGKGMDFITEHGRESFDMLMAEHPESDEEIVADIVFNGQLNGEDIDILEEAQRNPNEIVFNRVDLAKLYTLAPEEAEYIAERAVLGFHGTRSAALAGILKDGEMASAMHLRSKKAFLLTGEHIFQKPHGQGSISLTSLAGLSTGTFNHSGYFSQPRTLEDLKKGLDESIEATKNDSTFKPEVVEAIFDDVRRAIKVIEENPESLEAQLALMNFPVVIGVSREGIYKSEKVEDQGPRTNRNGIVLGVGYEHEFQVITDKIDKSGIPLLLVPKDKVELVRSLCKQYGFEDTRVGEIETYIDALVPEHLKEFNNWQK